MKAYRVEQTDELLIGYTGNQHMDAATYQNFLDVWAARLNTGRRFGVILVYEAHHHEHHERDAEEENRMSRAISNFRKYREQVNQACTGFSRVFPPEWLASMNDEALKKYRTRTEQLTEYMFGIRGQNFVKLTDAKAWLHSIKHEPPLELSETPVMREQQDAGLYYGSTTGMTELVAQKIQAAAKQTGLHLHPVNIADMKNPHELMKHDRLILGVPTWNIGQLQDDWLLLFPHLDDLDFTHKKVALFGVGDQKGYPDNFLDAMGILADKLMARGASIIGQTSAQDYSFNHSKALKNNQFIGLGIDEYNQEDKTRQRIQAWLTQIQQEFTTRVLESRF